MSGLIGFFKDCFPNVQNIDYSRPWEDLKPYEKKARHINTNNSINDNTKSNNDNKEGESETPMVHSPLLQRRSIFQQQQQQGGGIEYTEHALSFVEWRQMNKQMMEVYWDRRLVPQELDDDDAEDNLEDDGEEDDKIEEDWGDERDDPGEEDGDQAEEQESSTPMRLESQPPLPEHTTPERCAVLKVKRNRRIPPLYQAIHSVKTMAYLDLTTRDVSIDLCRVNKVWRSRTTKRGLQYLNSSEQQLFRQNCCVFPGRMPRTVFGHLQDDGPLACCYDQVLSLEIEQLTPHIPSQRRSIRVFLYNAYAKATSEWMAEQTTVKGDKGDASSYYILSLSKIPAKCILPHALDPRDWWDQEHILPYCICIGDDSDMVVQDSKGKSAAEIKVRMDSADMEIRIAKTPVNQDVGPELALSPNLFRGPPDEGDEEFLPTDDPLLIQAWKTYRQAQIPPPHIADPPSPRAVPFSNPPHPHAIVPPLAPRVIPNFSTAAAPPPPLLNATAHVPVGRVPAPVPALPNRPPPPSPVHRPIEPMDFDGGPTRKRAHISDVTNLPNPPPTLRYERISALLPLYEQSRLATVRQQPVVHLYGVVVGFTVPSQTKRGDWMSQCNLVDETCTVPVTLIIFTREAAHLPQFQKMGDVLRMHRILVGQWNGSLQLTGRKESSFVVVRRSETIDGKASWKPEPTACKEYHFETSDEQRSQNLWHWGQKLIERQPTMLQADNKFTLGNMTNLTEDDDRSSRDRDLTVMVTAKISNPVIERTSISAYGFLRVWDGTGQAPSDPFPIDLTPSSQVRLRQGDPPPTAVSKIASIVRRMKESDASTDGIVAGMQIPESTCGKVANVIIWEHYHWNLIEKHVQTGTFLRLRNVEVRHYMTNRFRSLMVHSRSWLSPLPDTTFEVKDLLKEHDRRVKRNEYNPSSGLLPSTQNQRSPAEPPVAPSTAATMNQRLGSGLAAFINSKEKRPKRSKADDRSKKRRLDNGTLYEGIVRLLPTTVPKYEGNLAVYCNTTFTPPLYQCFVTMVDASNVSLPVLVAGVAGDTLFGIPAQVALTNGRREAPFDTNVAWNASIQSVWKGSKEFFILKEIEPVDPVV